ncbi:efflux RND transporter permease subunit [Pelagibaculum spongiae]|uniref:Multidrug efflux protein n=1 Tax=Pelagibaculum spongiae TaxID=2080658 RepID=A0A2V1GRE3_9GAMM|nr:efflux RND transporter permease subunit [Pelagibaculum spongiae]PVZ63869.1 multidrug efflux protein [Pelagibaculum spongiae]
MKFTDLFIKRPVLAMVISMMILLLGLQAANQLPVRQFPKTDDAVITVTTAYPGASARLVQGFITTPLQQKIASADGVDFVTSTSRQSASEIKVNVKRGFDSTAALSEVMAKVNEAKGELPADAMDPIITKGGQGNMLMYVSFQSDLQSAEQITDYLTRVIRPQLATMSGVGAVEIYGAKTYSMRIWLDPVKMAAFEVTAADVNQSLTSSNFISAAGSTKGELLTTSVNAETDLNNPEAFGQIIIRSNEMGQVHLRDVAKIELASEDQESYVTMGGKEALMIGIDSAPGSNPLDVIAGVRQRLETLQNELPSGMSLFIAYDATDFIRSSIDEVVKTLGEASIIVILVVFMFLGAFRVVTIPIITIPLSMVGVLFFMLVMGYSINLLTLLALVLAIGLVVDDAIVVVENVHRHIEDGKTPYDAAIHGAREIALPVISMTITLAAVYAPIGFVGGLTGSLFREFAFTLAGAVIISGIIALTLSPMMASRILRPSSEDGKLVKMLDKFFESVSHIYQRSLHDMLNYRPVIVMMALVLFATLPLLTMVSQSELAPPEDGGFMFVVATPPRYANVDYTRQYTEQFEDQFRQFPEFAQSFIFNNPGQVFGGMQLKPWGERERGVVEIQKELQNRYLATNPGLQVFSFVPPALPSGGGGLPMQFVITSTAGYDALDRVANQLVQEAMKSGLFMFANSDLKFDRPEYQLSIDRDRAGQLGISMQSIGSTLATMLGNGEVNRFSLDGRSYKVIPQAPRDFRLNEEWLTRYQVRTASGEMVALSTLVKVTKEVRPNALNQFQQLNSAKVQGMIMPGKSMGEAVTFMEAKLKEIAPTGFSYDYEGESRQFKLESDNLTTTLIFAMIVIFLVLAAQFESFRDPLVVMFSVPLSMFGALVPIAMGLTSLNIYTQIGLVTLIGLITKHGILIVEFANKLREENPQLSRREAVEEAAAIRLRPILMTTAAMVLGVVPLLFADGAGAASRFAIGLVIASGMSVGTVFTLYVVPVFYSYLARKDRSALSGDKPTANIAMASPQ